MAFCQESPLISPSSFTNSRFLKGLALYSRIFLGIVFVWAAIGKITDIRGFVILVGDYRLLPEFLIVPVSFTLPWLEMLCGLILLYGRYLRPVSAVVGGLLLVFVVAIIISITRGLDIDCGCFEIPFLGSSKVGWFPVIRNVVLLGMTAAVYCAEPRVVDRASPGGPLNPRCGRDGLSGN